MITREEIRKHLEKQIDTVLEQAANKMLVYGILHDAGFPVTEPSAVNYVPIGMKV